MKEGKKNKIGGREKKGLPTIKEAKLVSIKGLGVGSPALKVIWSNCGK
jgi:hypothetical protein